MIYFNFLPFSVRFYLIMFGIVFACFTRNISFASLDEARISQGNKHKQNYGNRARQNKHNNSVGVVILSLKSIKQNWSTQQKLVQNVQNGRFDV
jgi:predicted RND superfamily exporter protein